MKDLDFDELDKAVNSLMGGVKPQAEEKDNQKTLTIASTLNEDERPAYEKVEVAAKKIGSETITLPGEGASSERVIEVPASKGRVGGRFMDVMHRSSAMKPPIAAPTPAASVAPTTPSAAVVVPAPVLASVELKTEKKVEVAAKKAIEPALVEPVSPSKEPAVSTESVEPMVPNEPLVSPFLADAKVEKRPLGGATPSLGDEAELLEATEEKPEVAENLEAAQLAPAIPTPVPDEYHNELLAIEAQGAQEAPAEIDASAPAPVSQPETVVEPELTESKPSTPLEKSGAIYDVNDYHQPLNHPAKKPSGWLWVILTIILIAVCGGAAAAFYLLTT